jgi:hypothetical protein
MERDRIVLAFEQDLAPEQMKQLVQTGYLWCNFSPSNREHAEALWAASHEVSSSMALTVVAHPQPPTLAVLETWLEEALAHFPDVRLVEVSGFPDEGVASVLLKERGFEKLEQYVYGRPAPA